MRASLVVVVLAVTCACSGSPGGPTSSGGGIVTDISGAWRGTFASSNNASEEITVNVTQKGSSVSATWSGDLVSWSGNMTATLSGSSLDGQLSFRGVTAEGTVCTGNATVSGSITSTAIALSGANGVVGGSCPASLPTAIRIDLHR